MFYNILTDDEREKINAENERLLQELLAGESYQKKLDYYKNVLNYFSHKKEAVQLHNLIKTLCIKVASSVEDPRGFSNIADPKTIAIGSPVDFSDRSSVATQLYRFGDGVLGGRYEFEKHPEAEKIHSLWQKLSLQEKHIFFDMCFEYMFSEEVDAAYKKEAEEAEVAEEMLADELEGGDFPEYKESKDDDGFPDVLPFTN